MDSVSVIGTMIAACTFFIVIIIMAKPLQLLLKIIVNACLGIVGITAANFLLSSFGISVGINFLTAGFIGLLGLPGFISLFVIQIML